MTNIFREYNKPYDKINLSNSNLENKIINFNTEITTLYDNLVNDLNENNYSSNKPNNSNIRNYLLELKQSSNEINDILKNDINNSYMDYNIGIIRQEMDDINVLLADYDNKKNLMDEMLKKYNLTIQNYIETNTNRSYYIMFFWFLLLLIVLYAVVISIIEKQNESNIFSKIIFIISYFIILILLFRYLFSYFSDFQIIFN